MDCGHFLHVTQQLSLVAAVLIPHRAVIFLQHFLGFLCE